MTRRSPLSAIVLLGLACLVLLAVAATQSDDASFTAAVDAVRELLSDLQQVIGSK